MQIPKSIGLFTDKVGLVFVIGQKHAVVYRAEDQKVDEIDRCVVKRPKYSDREGHSEMRGSGDMNRVGGVSVGDRMQRISRLDFEKELKLHVKSIIKQYPHDIIYLFLPKPLQKKVLAMLPVTSQKLLNGIIEGNYVESNPIELLQMLKKQYKINP